jgi:hypothetical protein
MRAQNLLRVAHSRDKICTRNFFCVELRAHYLNRWGSDHVERSSLQQGLLYLSLRRPGATLVYVLLKSS